MRALGLEGEDKRGVPGKPYRTRVSKFSERLELREERRCN